MECVNRASDSDLDPGDGECSRKASLISTVIDTPSLIEELSLNVLQIKFMSTSYEIAFWWMPQNTCNDRSTLVQVMAWCCH